MSEEKNTSTGEQVIDTNAGEQVSTQTDSQGSTGDEANTEALKEAERAKVQKAELDKVPEWVKNKWLEEQASDFDNRYSEKRDKEQYEEALPKVVKDNNLTDDQRQFVESEVQRLRKYRDEDGKFMPYKEALRLVTKDLDSTTMKQAVKIAAGALPPSGAQVVNTFNLVSNAKFDKMTPGQQSEYMKKSKELHGGVNFN